MQELDIERIGTHLAAGDFDLVLCRSPSVAPAGWSFQPLLEDRLVVVCGPQHPLAGKRRVRLEQLWNETWLQGPVASAPQRAFDEMVAGAGASPQLRLVSTRATAIVWSMLQAQRLVSLTPFSVARQLLQAGELARIDVKVPVEFSPLGLMYRDTEE